jgi:hypothetical protein
MVYAPSSWIVSERDSEKGGIAWQVACVRNDAISVQCGPDPRTFFGASMGAVHSQAPEAFPPQQPANCQCRPSDQPLTLTITVWSSTECSRLPRTGRPSSTPPARHASDGPYSSHASMVCFRFYIVSRRLKPSPRHSTHLVSDETGPVRNPQAKPHLRGQGFVASLFFLSAPVTLTWSGSGKGVWHRRRLEGAPSEENIKENLSFHPRFDRGFPPTDDGQ